MTLQPIALGNMSPDMLCFANLVVTRCLILDRARLQIKSSESLGPLLRLPQLLATYFPRAEGTKPPGVVNSANGEFGDQKDGGCRSPYPATFLAGQLAGTENNTHRGHSGGQNKAREKIVRGPDTPIISYYSHRHFRELFPRVLTGPTLTFLTSDNSLTTQGGEDFERGCLQPEAVLWQ
ncbi:hypothetical protein ASPVEDRAFT_253713 [Aspergillus versicolor CBS 583.65]|uniref:Uncharacterized protein n=1 Tax=Aspergillus versicolor CBS 583.65 TaxID=1036611 RepID=A0A1L9P5M7_ASPVE|nr:uncharacterized protein ASPVEDRAFT_253713 [Aspergillus versicolor CBS 583.65]OJI96808.1 hypothetical protein ASPVEDRAFT_253713 [Aspergillus versicolor CBS 583.65]